MSHLELSASSQPHVELESETVSERLVRAVKNARLLLESGITTVRDCGSSFDLLKLARRTEHYPFRLPRLMLCGPPITPRMGHMQDFRGEAEGTAEIEAMIDRLFAGGAASLKLMGCGGRMTPGTHPERVAYAPEHFQLVAKRTRARDLGSVVHVLASESIRRATQARFDSLEHCAFFELDSEGRMQRVYDPEIAESVAASGASVMSNLSTATRSHERLRAARQRGCVRSAHELAQFDQMIENFGRLSALGIPMVCGTDDGVRDTGFEDT